jgi:threonine/homoserine/homoserine lactone efflux protein
MTGSHLYLAFVVATTVLMLIPGPNVALIAANSIAHGTRFGLLTVAGTSAATVLQLSLVALGMTTLLGQLAPWFEGLRWVGVAYLVYLGLKHWFAPADDLSDISAQQRSTRRIFARAFLVSLTNPKTLFFYGAFFPQFVSRDRGATAQVLTLSLTFLLVAIGVDSIWALFAGQMRFVFGARPGLRNKLTGGLLMGAGLGLALARRR